MSGIEIPKITGEWQLLFRPERCGNYINDHSIIKDRDGKWHLFGITSMEGYRHTSVILCMQYRKMGCTAV